MRKATSLCLLVMITEATQACPQEFHDSKILYCNLECQGYDNQDGCQQADADAFCVLSQCCEDSVATYFEIKSATNVPGFACGLNSLGTDHGNYFGYTNVHTGPDIKSDHGDGDAITNAVCTPCAGSAPNVTQASLVYGLASSNVCPDGSAAVADAATCSALSGANGLEYQFEQTGSNFPVGCSKLISGSKTWFNNHSTGKGSSLFGVVCKQASQAPSSNICADPLQEMADATPIGLVNGVATDTCGNVKQKWMSGILDCSKDIGSGWTLKQFLPTISATCCGGTASVCDGTSTATTQVSGVIKLSISSVEGLSAIAVIRSKQHKVFLSTTIGKTYGLSSVNILEVDFARRLGSASVSRIQIGFVGVGTADPVSPSVFQQSLQTHFTKYGLEIHEVSIEFSMQSGSTEKAQETDRLVLVIFIASGLTACLVALLLGCAVRQRCCKKQAAIVVSDPNLVVVIAVASKPVILDVNAKAVDDDGTSSRGSTRTPSSGNAEDEENPELGMRTPSSGNAEDEENPELVSM